MPKIVVNSLKFYNQLKEGAAFTTSSYPNYNLAGAVGERIRAEIIINVSWESITTPLPWVSPADRTAYGNCFTYTVSEKKLERSSGSFRMDGFSVNDEIKLWWGDTNGDSSWYYATIAAMSDTIIYFVTNPITLGNVDLVSGQFYNMQLIGISPLTALIFKYGLVPNDEAFGDYSKVSQNEQAYYTSGIGTGSPRDTTTIEMTKIGNYLDWLNKPITGNINAKCSYVQDVGNYQQFKIVHDFLNIFYYFSHN